VQLWVSGVVGHTGKYGERARETGNGRDSGRTSGNIRIRESPMGFESLLTLLEARRKPLFPIVYSNCGERIPRGPHVTRAAAWQICGNYAASVWEFWHAIECWADTRQMSFRFSGLMHP